MLLPLAKNIRAGSHSCSIHPPARPVSVSSLYLYARPNRHSLQPAQNPPRTKPRRTSAPTWHPEQLASCGENFAPLASLTGEGPFLGSAWRIHLWPSPKISHIFPPASTKDSHAQKRRKIQAGRGSRAARGGGGSRSGQRGKGGGKMQAGKKSGQRN